eukprot:scaffold35146_cov96-Isochrysis_galbana.AAC.1
MQVARRGGEHEGGGRGGRPVPARRPRHQRMGGLRCNNVVVHLTRQRGSVAGGSRRREAAKGIAAGREVRAAGPARGGEGREGCGGALWGDTYQEWARVGCIRAPDEHLPATAAGRAATRHALAAAAGAAPAPVLSTSRAPHKVGGRQRTCVGGGVRPPPRALSTAAFCLPSAAKPPPPNPLPPKDRPCAAPTSRDWGTGASSACTVKDPSAV